MAEMLLRIVRPSHPRRPRPAGSAAHREVVSVASALVRADESPEQAFRLGLFALQFLH